MSGQVNNADTADVCMSASYSLIFLQNDLTDVRSPCSFSDRKTTLASTINVFAVFLNRNIKTNSVFTKNLLTDA